jgi:hypothetical protein
MDPTITNIDTQPDGQSLVVVLPPDCIAVADESTTPSARRKEPLYCTALKTDRTPCPNYAVKESPTQKCHAHGGLNEGRPVESAKFSKYLPTRIRERMEAFENDPNYVSLRGQIAAVSARMTQLFERITAGDSSNRRKDILTEMDLLVNQINTGLLPAEDLLAVDPDDPEIDIELTLARACKVIQAGRTIRRSILALQQQARTEVREDEVWLDIDKFSESLRKLKETEVKRMVAANQVLTVTESYNLIQRLVHFIEEFLPDKELRARAVRELYQMLERRGSK